MKKNWSKAGNWIINSKLSPPNLPGTQVTRQQLLAKVTHSKNSQLTIVHAPAGYGKTTFLKQWYERQLTNNGAVGWLSLDEEEKNPSLFFSYLIAALGKAGLSCHSLKKIVSQGIEEIPASSIAAILVNTLEQFDQELLLFFDDYHLVSGKALNELIQKTVSHLPENVSIILSSRVFPELAVRDLLTLGRVREVSASDLRFNLEETNTVIENGFQSFDIRRLWDRTEGWPIACHMINVLLRNQLFDKGHIDSFSGQTTDLAAYITEQVFASLTGREQKFLMYTAITNRFTGDLANALCVDIDCWEILETLERKDLFLVPLDTVGKWYRYHQLFREYLLERLRRNESENISHLHIKAAEWLFNNRHIPEATEHALKGGSMRLAAEMVESLGGWRLIYQDRIDWVMSILSRIEKPVLEMFPRLFMADLILLVKRGKPRDALRRGDEMHNRTNGFERWAGKPLEPIIRIEFGLVRKLILEDYNDQPVCEATLSFALEYLKSISNDDYILKALLHDDLSSAYIDVGMPDKADSHINNAMIMYEKAGYHYGAIYIYYHRANLYMECAKLHDASRELLKAKEIAHEYLDTNFNITANTSAYLADLAFMQNQLHEAQNLLDATLDFVEKHDGWFDLYAKAYTTAAGVTYITNGVENAILMLDRARRTAEERNLPRLKVLSDLTEIRLLLLAGQMTRALELASCIGINALAGHGPGPENLSVFIPERAKIVLARVLLMQNKAEDVLNLLQPLADTLQEKGRCRLLVEVWLLMARAAYDFNDNKRAESFFSKAVHISMYEEYKRPFIDEGEAVVRIYNILLNNHLVKVHGQRYRTFLREINHAIKQETGVIDNLITKHDLTLKEYQAIVELAKGLSNKEIASALYVTEDTIKYRLKKLFKKWNVSSRDAAIRRAREKLLI